MTEATEGAAEAVADDTVVAPEAIEGEPSGENAAAAQTEGEAPPAKPKKTAQERIDELTREKHDAKRDADFWREQAQRTQQPPPQAAPAAKADGEPDPANYTYGETDVQFITDKATFVARQAVREEFAQHQAQTRMQSGLAAFEQRMAQQYPDGEPSGVTVLKQARSLPQGITDVLLASDNGPKLADHLGRNPAEFQRISGLSPALQGVELAKLEAKLSAPQPKTLTTAPEPPTQVRGVGGQFKPDPATTDFAAFDKAYPL
jgi:hypothetical protein